MTTLRSAAAKVAMLDGLWLMKVHMPSERIAEFLENESYEVRSAALHYAGYFIRKPGSPLQPPVLKIPLSSGPYQLRLEALDVISGLPNRRSPIVKKLLAACQDDRDIEVRAKCRTLMKKAKG